MARRKSGVSGASDSDPSEPQSCLSHCPRRPSPCAARIPATPSPPIAAHAERITIMIDLSAAQLEPSNDAESESNPAMRAHAVMVSVDSIMIT